MTDPMKVTMMLADHAQAINGKLYIMGGGWTVAGIGATSAVGIIIEVPWDQANDKHKIDLRLVDTDGRPVIVPTPAGPKPLEVSGDFEVGRPPGVKKGSALPMVVAMNFPPLQLLPNTRYVWKLAIDGGATTHEVSFSTPVQPPTPPQS